MRQYELMVIFDPETDERAVQPLLDKFLTVVTTDGGSVDKIDHWGRRRLAYEINKKAEGLYAVANLTCTPDTSKELDRQMGLSEQVLRTKLMRVETPKVGSRKAKAAEAKAAKADAARAYAAKSQAPAAAAPAAATPEVEAPAAEAPAAEAPAAATPEAPKTDA